MLPTSISLEIQDTVIHRLELELAEWKRTRNSRLPIAKFPDEVLCKVFAEAWEPTLSHVPFGLLAGQVCHRWRGLVYQNPLLWSKIQVLKDTGVLLLEHMLNSTKDVPMSLSIVLPDSTPTMHRLGEIMNTQAARIQSLSLVGLHGTFSAVLGSHFDVAHPRLETLEATGIAKIRGLCPVPNTSGLESISAPNIRRIKVGHGAHGDTLTVPWKANLFAQCSHLTHLRAHHTLKSGSVQDLKDLLCVAPQLQELSILFECKYSQTLDLGESDASRKQSRIWLPCLRVLHLESTWATWAPVAALLDGMLFDVGMLEIFALKPGWEGASQCKTKAFVNQWWLTIRNACAKGGFCEPEVLRLFDGRSVQAWREVEDISKRRRVPWVLEAVEETLLPKECGVRVRAAEMKGSRATPWIALEAPASISFSDGSIYDCLWSFSSLKFVEIIHLPKDLLQAIERDAPNLEVIVIEPFSACKDFYSTLQELLKLRAGRPFPALKTLSLEGPREFYSDYRGVDPSRWARRRKEESLFQLPNGYCHAGSPSPSAAPEGQVALVKQPEEMRREDAERHNLYAEGEFMLDFADILWERKERDVPGRDVVGGGDLALETLEFVRFKQGMHEEIKNMILGSGVAREVVLRDRRGGL